MPDSDIDLGAIAAPIEQEEQGAERIVGGIPIFLPKIAENYTFNKGFKNCVNTLRRKVRADYDAVVAISGDEGTGKSVLANHIGMECDPRYTFEKNCLFSPNERSMVEAIRRLPRFSAINADEAIRVLYKQEWSSQIFINKFYRLCRQDNKISILVMPRFADFNEGFRNHRIMLWIHVLDRGLAVAFVKDWNIFSPDPWHMKDNYEVLRKSSGRVKLYSLPMERKLELLSRLDNFLDVITYPDLPEPQRIEYKTLAAQQKYEDVEEDLEKLAPRDKLWRDRFAKTILWLKKNKIKTKELRPEIGMTDDVLANFINAFKEKERINEVIMQKAKI